MVGAGSLVALVLARRVSYCLSCYEWSGAHHSDCPVPGSPILVHTLGETYQFIKITGGNASEAAGSVPASPQRPESAATSSTSQHVVSPLNDDARAGSNVPLPAASFKGGAINNHWGNIN